MTYRLSTRARETSALAAFLIALCAVLLCVLCACSGVRVVDSSPHAYISAASVSSSSSLDEASQVVDICIPFDAELNVEKGAASDLAITLDADGLNERTTRVDVQAKGSELHVLLHPSDEAKGIDTPYYFACYQGKLDIKSARDDGAFAHVSGADGANAVLDKTLSLTIPSGMAIQTLAKKRGETTIAVTQFAQIRCCTWLSIGDTQTFMHHHRFFAEDERTCAAALAETVNSTLKDEYKAKSDGRKVVISGVGSHAKETFDVAIVEGVGV